MMLTFGNTNSRHFFHTKVKFLIKEENNTPKFLFKTRMTDDWLSQLEETVKEKIKIIFFHRQTFPIFIFNKFLAEILATISHLTEQTKNTLTAGI